MWIKQRGVHPRWDWVQELDAPTLLSIRGQVREAYANLISRCLAQGEHLFVPEKRFPRIETPLGFTPNDFVRNVVEGSEFGKKLKVDFHNIRYFFHTIQIADGSYESGPREPFRRLENSLNAPRGGWIAKTRTTRA